MLQNEFLAIPPDHPLAKQFYDLVHVAQSALLTQHFAASRSGDSEHAKKIAAMIEANSIAIVALQNEYRRQVGADQSCTVGFTTNANGLPVVAGRPGGPGDPPITLN